MTSAGLSALKSRWPRAAPMSRIACAFRSRATTWYALTICWHVKAVAADLTFPVHNQSYSCNTFPSIVKRIDGALPSPRQFGIVAKIFLLKDITDLFQSLSERWKQDQSLISRFLAGKGAQDLSHTRIRCGLIFALQSIGSKGWINKL